MVAFDVDFITRHVLQKDTSSYRSTKGTQLYWLSTQGSNQSVLLDDAGGEG
jgi:hypothetical protein